MVATPKISLKVKISLNQLKTQILLKSPNNVGKIHILHKLSLNL